MEIQVVVSGWLSQLAGYIPLGYGFGAGMVSAVNPCGFAMLPVYLSLYLGANEEGYKESSIFLRILRACWVTCNVTLGFGLLFLLVRAVIIGGGQFLMHYIPWFAVVVGVVLIGTGCWLLLGRHFAVPWFSSTAAKIGDPRQMSFTGFFFFGLAFGITSLSCTLPVFLAVVGSSIAQGDYIHGLSQFVAFVFGMASVLLVLTVGIAFVKQGLVVGYMRKILPYIQAISGLFLLAAGGYVIYYWVASGLLL